jgi:DNA-binding SARP family transcriptional activator
MDDNNKSGFRYRLVALGSPRLEIIDDEGRQRTVGPGKPLALVAYLALSPRRTATRDLLCDLLWGDRNPEQARPHLRQTLWLIKNQIGESIIKTAGDSLMLDCAVETDVHEFLKLVERDELEPAINLYNGDFFTGYAAPGAGGFEEWANLERTRLRSRFVHAAETTGRRALDSGHSADAIALGQKMRSVDPNGQAGWRLVLEGLVASGDMIGARADADQFEDWLRREEWEPEPASTASIQIARKSPTTIEEARTEDLVAELVGRESQFSAIHDAWLEVQSGGTRLVHISGDAGLGKTRLTRDLLARVRAERGRVRYVHANHGERGIPFSFASQIAESLSSLSGAGGVTDAAARTLVSLNPTLSSRYTNHTGSVEHLETLRVGIALLDLVSSVTAEKAVAIALDDLHWADQESRDALRIVVSRIVKENILLITTSRPHYGNVVSRSDVLHIEVARLATDDVALLVASLARLPDEEWAALLPERLNRAANGQPLGILQILRHCIDAGLLERTNESWMASDPIALQHAVEERGENDQRLFFLNESERQLMLAVSVAGVPVPKAMLVDALGYSARELETMADSVELGGLLIAENGEWLPAHDSIAEQLIRQSPASEVKATHRMLGVVMSRHRESSWQARSVRHLVAAEMWKEASDAIAGIARIQGVSSKRIRSTVQSLIERDDPRIVSRIISALPLRVRYPQLRRQLAVAGFAIASGIGIMAYVRYRDSELLKHTAITVIQKTDDGRSDILLGTLDPLRWNPAIPIELRKLRTADIWLGQHLGGAIARPGTNQWVVNRIYPDLGEGELELISIDGKSQRLTRSRGDDLPASFSPDGRKLLFLTTRWSSNGWPDVAILDVPSGSVQRISNQSFNHGSGVWSPDGTRIVYSRQSASEADREMCIADADGSHTWCHQIDGWSRISPIGWIDDHRLLISGDSGRLTMSSGIYDLSDRSVRRSDYPRYSEIRVDPSGQWALTRMATAGSELRISPSTQFGRSVALGSDSAAPEDIRFLSPVRNPNYLDSVSIDRALHVYAGIPYQLRARGWTERGREIRPAVMRWRSLTPGIASVDSMGVLQARKSGSAVIEISAGGWRITADTINIIDEPPARLIVQESWDNSAFSRWKRFGQPKPVVMDDPHGRVMLNNGDGNFLSGAYYSKGIGAESGVTLDAEISTPITEFKWQLIEVLLYSFSNPRQLEKWDHTTGYISRYLDLASSPGCAFQYPGGEGPESLTRPSWFPSWQLATRDSSSVLHKGSWYKVRVQLFPDGRCGLAINGHPLMIAASRVSTAVPVLPIIEGNTVGGKILVGRVAIWSGVPTDIDWSKLKFDGYQWVIASGRDR